MNCFAAACKAFSLVINSKKTVPMHQLTCSDIFQANIFVNGTRLEKVNNFCYLGSFMSKDRYLEKERQSRIG